MKRRIFGLLFIAGSLYTTTAFSQGFLNKVKDKANKALNKSVDKQVDKKTGTSSNENNNPGNDNSGNNNSSSSSGKPVNKGGGGLKNTEPPDVKAQMAEAETAHAAKNYSDARYSLQQALMGVEIQLGRKILKSLPIKLNALPADTLQDKVVSTQWGWSNLTIQRVYKDGADKQVTVNIGNNGLYSGWVNLYLANAGMVQANSDQQNIKQVRVKGNKAIIQYDDSKGYTLIVPVGQTSMIAWECINLASEQEVMDAASLFDIEGLKKMLGEK
jgi:hypothetical protein